MLTRLLHDVQVGHVDAIVVYQVDKVLGMRARARGENQNLQNQLLDKQDTVQHESQRAPVRPPKRPSS
jgi:hypothetical protein